ncbi:MBL fold metallo-hydrolase [Planococcus sp. APC 4015]|nr:MBL fold metallo-hydrolase [Planococcus sp. APC 4015]
MRLNDHLHRIGSDIVAAYLIVTPEGVTVVDAGMPGQWKELLSELASLGLGLADVKGLIVTHGDDDHIGFAERLRVEAGVPVFVHAADAGRARGEAAPKTPMPKMKPGPTLGFFAYGLRKGAMRTKPLTEVVEVTDGDALDLPGAPRIIGLPGHSPGSIAIHSPVARALFVGDALTTRHVTTGRVGAQPAPFTDDPTQASASLARIADVDATWVLPGHGAPWQGSPASIVEAIRADAG